MSGPLVFELSDIDSDDDDDARDVIREPKWRNVSGFMAEVYAGQSFVALFLKLRGVSGVDAAKLMGCSKAAAYQRLWKAERILHDCVANEVEQLAKAKYPREVKIVAAFGQSLSYFRTDADPLCAHCATIGVERRKLYRHIEGNAHMDCHWAYLASCAHPYWPVAA